MVGPPLDFDSPGPNDLAQLAYDDDFWKAIINRLIVVSKFIDPADLVADLKHRDVYAEGCKLWYSDKHNHAKVRPFAPCTCRVLSLNTSTGCCGPLVGADYITVTNQPALSNTLSYSSCT